MLCTRVYWSHYYTRSYCNYLSYLFGFAHPKICSVVSFGNASYPGGFSSLLNMSTASLNKIGQGHAGSVSYLGKPNISLMLADFLFSVSTINKISDTSLVVDKPLDQYSHIYRVLILAFILFPIWKNDKIIPQRWSTDNFTEALSVIKAVDRRFLWSNSLGWFKHLDFQASVSEPCLLAHAVGRTHAQENRGWVNIKTQLVAPEMALQSEWWLTASDW